jgi:hypothetical protein
MTKKLLKADEPQLPSDGAATEGEDTEGHNMWINPSSGRDVARGRNADIERQVRDRQREKDAKKKR